MTCLYDRKHGLPLYNLNHSIEQNKFGTQPTGVRTTCIEPKKQFGNLDRELKPYDRVGKFAQQLTIQGMHVTIEKYSHKVYLFGSDTN